MKSLDSRPQRTLARPAVVTGVGYLSGKTITARFLPAAPNTGVVFVRSDTPERGSIPARIDCVVECSRRTTLGSGNNRVALIEHMLAALAGYRIDNCRIEIDGPEAPGLDGSAHEYFRAIELAGITLQDEPREIWAVQRTMVVAGDNATIAIHPCERDVFRCSYILDYGHQSAITPQRWTCDVDPQSFGNDICRSRTFLLYAEAEQLRRQGVGRRTTPRDLLVFDDQGPIDNALRWRDEPARHKILDIVGDLSLLGCDIRGHVVGYRSGHSLNVALARRIAEEIEAARTRVAHAA